MKNIAKSKSLGSCTAGYLMIFVTGLLWGTIGIFVKEMSLGGANALLISFLRVSLAFIVMLIFTVLRGGIGSLKISRRQLLQCALLGIVCQGIYNIFYSIAVVTVGVSVSAVLLNVAPVFTLAVSAVFFSEDMGIRKIIAVVVNIVGCTLTVTGGRLDLQTLSATGILCGIGAGISYGMTAVFGKLAVAEGDPFATSTYSYLFAAMILMLPAKPWILVTASSGLQLGRILLSGLLLAVIPTAIAYLLYYKGLSLLSEMSRVPVIASGETVVAALLGMTVYNEKPGAVGWLGVTMVIFSISLMNKKNQ